MRVSLDGGDAAPIAHLEGGSVRAAFEDGVHDVFFARESSLTTAPRLVVRSTERGVLGEVPSVAERRPLPNVALTMAGPDGAHVGIVRPHGYIEGARYAVIDAAYGGPGHEVVEADGSRWLLAQWMADATGAIVVAIDANGTPGRGRAWERAIAGKLADVPLQGHDAALQALAASHPEMDGSRMGVYGWSFGGYFSALAALRRPDVFRAAAAIAPVTEWRNYDTAYTERYLGATRDERRCVRRGLGPHVRSQAPPAARAARLLRRARDRRRQRVLLSFAQAGRRAREGGAFVRARAVSGADAPVRGRGRDGGGLARVGAGAEDRAGELTNARARIRGRPWRSGACTCLRCSRRST